MDRLEEVPWCPCCTVVVPTDALLSMRSPKPIIPILLGINLHSSLLLLSWEWMSCAQPRDLNPARSSSAHSAGWIDDPRQVVGNLIDELCKSELGRGRSRGRQEASVRG